MTSTRYGAVIRALREAVAAGLTGPEGALPTEAELCASHGASRSTIRRALVALRAEGVVLSRQGSGWTVAPEHRGQPAARYRVRATTAAASGRQPRQELVGHHWRRPPADVAAALKAAGRRPLLMVERLTRAGDRGQAIHRAEVWFSRDQSTRLDPGEACRHPPARLLARAGQSMARFDQFVEAVAANRRDRELLGLHLGKPVLQVVRTAYGPDGAPLFRSLHRHPGHNTELEIWLPTSDRPTDGRVTIDGDF